MDQTVIRPDVEPVTSRVSFSTTWESLGPFRIGTREAVWGADPLEAEGGFPSLAYDAHRGFHSPLAANASIQWNIDSFETSCIENEASVKLSLQYDHVDWSFLQSIYGWAALQYQTWTRGNLWSSSNTTVRVAIYPANILEFWLNDHHVFGGDFFGFERVPVILDLLPGRNVFNVRLVRDVRAMGGTGRPTIDAMLKVHVVYGPVQVVRNSLVIPDMIEGRFASTFASVVVCNQADDEITVFAVKPVDGDIELLDEHVRLAQGQSKPIEFRVDSLAPTTPNTTLHLMYRVGNSDLPNILQCGFQVIQRKINDPHKFTFRHPSGSISYAILRPPSVKASRGHDAQLPILLGLHGAGLEADSYQVRHMLDAAPDLAAWALFPTGMSPWSGDDWHSWGMADIQAAISAVPEWILRHRWTGPGVYLEKYLVSGHSNGGQGTWFMALHQPDRIIAAAPASGYSSIENYLPYILWNEADPAQSAILYSSRTNLKHEILIQNIQHTPVLIQHGQDDENVPAYHSRLMKSLAAQAKSRLNYVELPRRNHWFEGAMTTPALQDFYNEQLASDFKNTTVPNEFEFVCASSNDFGSRYGILVDQLQTPDRLGRVSVRTGGSVDSSLWHLTTENVHRLRFDFSELGSNVPDAIKIDKALPFLVGTMTSCTSFTSERNGEWIVDQSEGHQDLSQRRGKQRGALDAILNTQGPFQIVFSSMATYHLALQVSRNLLQYFGADSKLLSMNHYQNAVSDGGNVILLVVGMDVPVAQTASFPLAFRDGELSIYEKRYGHRYVELTDGMGGYWLRPLPNERLELVLWGCDISGLQRSARMAPTITGAGQPDFALFGKAVGWKGHGGALAMGFFDYEWEISGGSYLP